LPRFYPHVDRYALAGFDVTLVHNSAWQNGQSASVRAGILALPARVEAVFFLLGDQPFVFPDLIQSLTQKFLETNPSILAPFVGDKRANPVLFSREMFEVLCQLQGDAGARSIFKQYPPEPMQWADERILFDIDTPEDYQRLLAMSSY
jgi:molybdenum cofactor cytidylyltransferase